MSVMPNPRPACQHATESQPLMSELHRENTCSGDNASISITSSEASQSVWTIISEDSGELHPVVHTTTTRHCCPEELHSVVHTTTTRHCSREELHPVVHTTTTRHGYPEQFHIPTNVRSRTRKRKFKTATLKKMYLLDSSSTESETECLDTSKGLARNTKCTSRSRSVAKRMSAGTSFRSSQELSSCDSSSDSSENKGIIARPYPLKSIPNRNSSSKFDERQRDIPISHCSCHSSSSESDDDQQLKSRSLQSPVERHRDSSSDFHKHGERITQHLIRDIEHGSSSDSDSVQSSFVHQFSKESSSCSDFDYEMQHNNMQSYPKQGSSCSDFDGRESIDDAQQSTVTHDSSTVSNDDQSSTSPLFKVDIPHREVSSDETQKTVQSGYVPKCTEHISIKLEKHADDPIAWNVYDNLPIAKQKPQEDIVGRMSAFRPSSHTEYKIQSNQPLNTDNATNNRNTSDELYANTFVPCILASISNACSAAPQLYESVSLSSFSEDIPPDTKNQPNSSSNHNCVQPEVVAQSECSIFKPPAEILPSKRPNCSFKPGKSLIPRRISSHQTLLESRQDAYVPPPELPAANSSSLNHGDAKKYTEQVLRVFSNLVLAINRPTALAVTSENTKKTLNTEQSNNVVETEQGYDVLPYPDPQINSTINCSCPRKLTSSERHCILDKKNYNRRIRCKSSQLQISKESHLSPTNVIDSLTSTKTVDSATKLMYVPISRTPSTNDYADKVAMLIQEENSSDYESDSDISPQTPSEYAPQTYRVNNCNFPDAACSSDDNDYRDNVYVRPYEGTANNYYAPSPDYNSFDSDSDIDDLTASPIFPDHLETFQDSFHSYTSSLNSRSAFHVPFECKESERENETFSHGFESPCTHNNNRFMIPLGCSIAEAFNQSNNVGDPNTVNEIPELDSREEMESNSLSTQSPTKLDDMLTEILDMLRSVWSLFLSFFENNQTHTAQASVRFFLFNIIPSHYYKMMELDRKLRWMITKATSFTCM